MPLRIIDREKLPTLDAVRAHIRARRDDLKQCVIGFSGGKDSVALAKLVHEIEPLVPLVYASCPGCEWPEHEGFVREWGAEFLDTGHGWDWFRANPWAFLYSDSKSAERWFKTHHRGHLRRYARDKGLILLWGNRTADGNTVPAVRYTTECELWMPLRDLGDAEILAIAGSSRSPIYSIPTVGGTGYVPGRLRGTVAERRAVVVDRVPEYLCAFDEIARSKFGAAS